MFQHIQHFHFTYGFFLFGYDDDELIRSRARAPAIRLARFISIYTSEKFGENPARKIKGSAQNTTKNASHKMALHLKW